MKVCHKTCIFFLFPIINKYLCMAERSLLSRCPSYLFPSTCSLSDVLHVCQKFLQYEEKNCRLNFVGGKISLMDEYVIVCAL